MSALTKRALGWKLAMRLGLLAVLATLAALILAGTAQAAPGARWTISSLAAPTTFAPGDTGDLFSLRAVAVGNAPVLTGQVTLTDALPAGVTPVAAYGTLSLGVAQQSLQLSEKPCTTSGQVVTCSIPASELEALGVPLVPGEVPTFTAGITVDVSPTASGSLTNVARIEGGGAAPAITSQSNPVGIGPVPPGLAYSSTEIVNEDGSPAQQAGSHPYEFVSTLRFNAGGVLPPPNEFEPTPEPLPAGAVKDVEVALPPGFVGNPLSAPRCPQRDFQTTNSQYSCPVSTQVGSITLAFYKTQANRPPSNFPIYNIEPSGNQPAELGFSVSSIIHVPMLFRVRSNGDYGLTAQLRNISSGDPVETAVVSIWGDPSAPGHDPLRIGTLGNDPTTCLGEGCPKPEESKTAFLTTPSACSSDRPAGLSLDFWQAPGATLPSGLPNLGHPGWTAFDSPLFDGVTGCGALSLTSAAGSPALDVHPNGSHSAGAPSGYDVNLSVPQEEDPHTLATPTLKDVSVTLPKGTVVSASSAQGLGACSEDQIELHSNEALKPGNCPDSSKLGTAEIFSPLLEKPLTGSLFLAQQGNAGSAHGSNPFGSLLTVYLEAAGSGVLVKLAGKVDLDGSNGQVTASFENNPQLPFDEIKVHMFDGPRAALANPSACGDAAGSASLTPYGATAATAVGGRSFAVDSCGPARFKPSFHAGDTGTQRGGAYGPIAVSFGRDDSDQDLSGLTVKMPPGLLARIAGVAQCGEAEANAGTCPATSQIGTTTVTAGPGSSPITLPQSGQPADPVYLTGPYKGAAYGLSVVTPAVAGPFDLGTVVVRASLAVDPTTAQVTATSDPLPTMLQGVPLDIRNVNLNIDRSGFTLNPTDCDAQSIDATLTSTGGMTARASAPFQAVDCASLPFRPRLKLSLKGSTKHAGHPALKAVVTYPQEGSFANIARAQVNLPHSEFIDQANLNKTCTRPVLLAGHCPTSTIYGHVKAWTPLLNGPLQGPVYLVGGYGYKLPALVAELNGQIRILLVGKVDSGKNKGIRNTFEAVPDAPVSRFVLHMKGGRKYSLLENSEDLCRKPQRAGGRFVAQNGAVAVLHPKIASSCGAKNASRKSRNR